MVKINFENSRIIGHFGLEIGQGRSSVNSEHREWIFWQDIRMVEQIVLCALVRIRRHAHHSAVDALCRGSSSNVDAEIDENHDHHRDVERGWGGEYHIRPTRICWSASARSVFVLEENHRYCHLKWTWWYHILSFARKWKWKTIKWSLALPW